jgi:organic hydroperoxide reductase OsmC/OhrA
MMGQFDPRQCSGRVCDATWPPRTSIAEQVEMKPLPHIYEVGLSGGAAGYAALATDGVPPLSSAPPRDFDGPGDAWSPEHLLLASVLACFMFTFRAVARGSKFDFLSLDLTGSGTVDRKDGTTRFTEIVLKPRLTLPKGADPERANWVLEKGKTACLVTASLAVPVHLEAEILAEA